MEDLKLYLSGVVCATCLSSDRDLFYIKNVPHVQGLLPKLQFDVENDRICWECNATVLKFIKFQEKAYTSQELFQDFVEGNMKALKTQSNLKWIVTINGEAQQRLDTTSKIVFKQDDDKDEIESINMDDADNNNISYIELVEFGSKEGEKDIENCYEALDEIVPDDLKIPDNFQINDDEVNKLINATLKVLLEDAAAKKDVNAPNIGDVIIYETDGDDDHVNDNEFVNDGDNNECADHNDIDKDCIKNVVLKMEVNEKFKRGKNVSRKVLTEIERGTMINREKQNACYRKALFKCETCVYGYDTAREYMDHMKKHDETRGPEVCNICKQRFSDKTTLTDHWSRHYTAFYCTACGYTSRFLKFIISHQEKKACEKSYPAWLQCDMCDDEFALESLLIHHKNTMHRMERKRKRSERKYSRVDTSKGTARKRND